MIFFDWLRERFSSKIETRVVTTIDDRLASKDSQINALMKDNQAKAGEISRMKADERKKDQVQYYTSQEKKKSNELFNKQTEINEEKFEDAFSLKDFFYYLFKNPKYKLDVMDRDMSTKMAEFGNFVIFKDGEFAILDKDNEILSKGANLNNVFFKPGSLKGQVNKKLIRLPCNKDWQGIPDIEEVEMPELTYNNGKIKWSKFTRKPLMKLLIDREREINSLSETLAEKEETISGFVKSSRTLKRDKDIIKSKYNTLETEMSVNTQRYKKMQQRFRNLETRLAQSQSMRTLAEDLKDKFKNSLDELSEFVTQKLAKTDGDIFMDKVKDMLDYINSIKPSQIVIPQQNQPTKQTPKSQ